jgi:membrane protein implicated in regulation of membrane protease activity
MKPNKLALVFELLGGLFGWIWIGAVIWFFVAIALMLFWDGNWWNALYAFLLGAVTKWLAGGFFANRDQEMNRDS